MDFFHSLPVPEFWEWIFFIPFPFPKFGNGFFIPFPFPNFGNGIFSFPSHSRNLGMDFFIPFPFPNFGNGLFQFPSRSRISGLGFFNSFPVPEPSKVIPAHPCHQHDVNLLTIRHLFKRPLTLERISSSFVDALFKCPWCSWDARSKLSGQKHIRRRH